MAGAFGPTHLNDDVFPELIRVVKPGKYSTLISLKITVVLNNSNSLIGLFV